MQGLPALLHNLSQGSVASGALAAGMTPMFGPAGAGAAAGVRPAALGYTLG